MRQVATPAPCGADTLVCSADTPVGAGRHECRPCRLKPAPQTLMAANGFSLSEPKWGLMQGRVCKLDPVPHNQAYCDCLTETVSCRTPRTALVDVSGVVTATMLLPGATVAGIVRSMRQTPNIPGARPEYVTLSSTNCVPRITRGFHAVGICVSGVRSPSAGALSTNPWPVPKIEIDVPRAAGLVGLFMLPSALVASA